MYPYDLYVWGNVKSKIYSNNPDTSEELGHSICETITSVEVSVPKMCVKFQTGLKFVSEKKEKKENILNIYCDGEFL